jgi:hypothetical protein
LNVLSLLSPSSVDGFKRVVAFGLTRDGGLQNNRMVGRAKSFLSQDLPRDDADEAKSTHYADGHHALFQFAGLKSHLQSGLVVARTCVTPHNAIVQSIYCTIFAIF